MRLGDTVMRFAFIIAALALVLSASADAQLMQTGIGSSGGVPVACGTGVIDLSTGCIQPMLRGL